MTEDQGEAAAARVRGVLSARLSSAKMWWGVSLTVQVMASAGAALSALFAGLPLWWPIFLAVASIAALLGRWRGDHLRQLGEPLLRQIEFFEGFGWPLNPKLVADALARAIAVEKVAAERAKEQGNFYASNRERGTARALENLRESAWWTQQNAHWLGVRATWLVVVLCVVGIVSLLMTASAMGAATPVTISKLLSAGVALVFAGNLVRLPFEYFRLSASGSEADQKASELIERGVPTEADALRILGNYQLARAMGPPLPDWLWKKRRDHLNRIWRETRSAT